MSTPTPKPQLHNSAINALSRCGELFRRRYIEHEKIPPGVRMLVGTATDKAITKNLKHKAANKTLLNPQEVQEESRDAFSKEWDNGVWLDPEERKDDLQLIKGEAIDKATRLALLHHRQLAPDLNPKTPENVQREFVLELEDYPVDLAGAIDLIDTMKDGREAIHDHKTTAKSPSKNAADDSSQLVMYSMAYNAIEGKMPAFAALDYLIDNKTPIVKTLTTEITEEDFKPLMRRIENAIEATEKGVFVPAREDDWWCSERFCGYHSTCPYVRRPVSIAIPTLSEINQINDTANH